MNFLRLNKTPFGGALIPLAIALLSVHGVAQDEEPFYLKADDRVVFYGDSITQQQLYSDYVETFVVTRFPQYRVSFTNSGVSGDRVIGGGYGLIDVRIKRDILPYKPTVMTMMLGMNDGQYKAFDQTVFDDYKKGYVSILDTVKASLPDVRFTLIEPSPFDDVTREPKFEGGYMAVVVRFSDFVKQTAEARHDQLVDFNTPVTELLKKTFPIDPTLAQQLLPDRTHPAPSTHLVMAEALLKKWNAPALVTRVELDAKAGKVVQAEQTQVSDVKTGEQISWKQDDTRLPFPLNFHDTMNALVLKNSDFTQSLNQEPLKVTGLTAPSYDLSIDGKSAGVFTKAQLEEGINLAVLPTPMQEQADAVHKLTVLRNQAHLLGWQMTTNPAVPAEKAAEQFAEDKKVEGQQHEAAQPKSHLYTLAPAAMPSLNLALNKSYISSDPNTSNWAPGLTDGSWADGQGTTFAEGTTPDFPKTVTIDLEKSQPVAKVVTGVPAFGSTKTITVSLSDDGKTFTDVGSYVFSLSKAERHDYTFPTKSARYIRLTYPDHYDEMVGFGSPFYCFTNEVEAYGPQ